MSTFGAPLTVPTGNAADRASQQVKLSFNSPVTCEGKFEIGFVNQKFQVAFNRLSGFQLLYLGHLETSNFWYFH